MGAALLCHGPLPLSPAVQVLTAMHRINLIRGDREPRQFVSVAMLPAALRAISPNAVTICSMFSGA